MINYTLDDIARATGSEITGNAKRTIRQICTDTRRIDLPADSLFIALKGPSHDGHRFLQEAFINGIRSFLVERLPEPLNEFPGSTFLIAGNTLQALQDLAALHRRHFKGKLIAITGSNGKTIIKEWLAQILQSFGQTAKSPKSYNSQIGVPLSVLNIPVSAQFAVMEAGISLPGEMNRLQKILEPDMGLISNIGDAHQENFKSLEEKTREKINLFKNCKEIFYCRDHELIHNELTAAGFHGHKHTWSRHLPADLLISNELTDGNICHLSGIYRSQPVSLTTPLSDPASVENLIHIWLILLHSGFEPETVQSCVSMLEPIQMRLEQKTGINRCTLINDYYNSDILSLKIALDLLFQQTSQPLKTLIISDIQQTGLSEEILYTEINRLLENRNIHRFIGIGPAISRNKHLFSRPVTVWPSTAEFINQMNTEDFHDQAILLKGARSFAFERISSLLEARIHATTLEIRMNDVRHNLEQYRKAVGPEVRIMAMVKAFSYGSGGIEMAKFLAHERIDYLGVAFADEGMEIRRAGINTPIMVMNPDFQQSDLIIEHHLEPEIYNWSGLRKFVKTIQNLGLSSYPVHLKLDTGMHRLGFDYRNTTELTDYLTSHPEIYLKSVFSHLAASEDPANDDFTRLQIIRFIKSCTQISSQIGYPFLRHILNSSGIDRFPDARFEMVRLGIGLYGFGNPGQSNLKPITTLKSVISQIHHLEPGESVGYGRGTILPEPCTVGIIPIGYADGIDRRLGNGNYRMIVKGVPVPTIGNICMDMTLLDLTGLGATEGDEVVVFGPRNPVNIMAGILDTIPYEVLTSISPRVKRIFQFE
jgi:Alr-MurF fusion protein